MIATRYALLCMLLATALLAGCPQEDTPEGTSPPPVGGEGQPGVDTLQAKLAAQDALKDAAYHNESRLREAMADRVAMGELGRGDVSELDGRAAAEELLSLPKAPSPEDVDVRVTGATTVGDVAEVEGYVLYKPLAEAKADPEVGGTIRPAALPVRLEVKSVDGKMKITKVTFEESPELEDSLPDEVWKLAELVSDYQEKRGELPQTPGDLLAFWATEHASLKIGEHGTLTYDPIEGKAEARFDFEF
ncbi:MAG: hypothetical protein GF320_13885 [Armatimonadia bacterium]|nr:hypothetical protein [Armatimonadia bacterium]